MDASAPGIVDPVISGSVRIILRLNTGRSDYDQLRPGATACDHCGRCSKIVSGYKVDSLFS